MVHLLRQNIRLLTWIVLNKIKKMNLLRSKWCDEQFTALIFYQPLTVSRYLLSNQNRGALWGFQQKQNIRSLEVVNKSLILTRDSFIHMSMDICSYILIHLDFLITHSFQRSHWVETLRTLHFPENMPGRWHPGV